MALKLVTIGSDQAPANVLNDGATNSNVLSVQQLQNQDANNPSSFFGALVASFGMLLNAGGTFDRLRAAIGTTGVLPVDTESTKATYAAGTYAITPAATPTDFFAVTGSATKTVRVRRITITGFATAAISIPTLLKKRTTANTGGTPTNLTAAQMDSNDGAPTAVVSTYAANPTTGTDGGTLFAENLNLGATGAAGRILWDFTTRNDKGLVLRGIAQQLVLNWAGVAVPAGTKLTIDVEWTEES